MRVNNLNAGIAFKGTFEGPEGFDELKTFVENQKLVPDNITLQLKEIKAYPGRGFAVDIFNDKGQKDTCLFGTEDNEEDLSRIINSIKKFVKHFLKINKD